MRIVIQAGSGGAGQRVSLSEDEVHHLKVRRAKEGQEVEVLDGAGLQGRGILVKGDREWMVDIEAAEVHESPRAVTLGVAAGDRDRFSWMVEKSVELGVTRIVPLESERTAGVATRLKDAHIPRLRRSVLEAIKQCGAAWAPAVENLVPLPALMSEPLNGTGWLAHRRGAPGSASLDESPITVIVGPEGGLTEAELELVESAGYSLISLGTYTLRFETAAIAAAAVVAQARMRGHHG